MTELVSKNIIHPLHPAPPHHHQSILALVDADAAFHQIHQFHQIILIDQLLTRDFTEMNIHHQPFQAAHHQPLCPVLQEPAHHPPQDFEYCIAGIVNVQNN